MFDKVTGESWEGKTLNPPSPDTGHLFIYYICAVGALRETMKLLTTLLLAASTATSFAIAETIDPLKITVTAKRTTSPVLTTPQAISILTSEVLERGQFSSLSEALESMAGVYIQRFGGNGSQAKVYLRGTSSNHSIILMDGRRLTSTNDGRAELENIPLDSIERIEVVRGGLSSKYGADAIGGVIQIFTKDLGSTSNSNRASITVGSQNTLKEKLEFIRGDSRFESKVVIANERTDGFDTHTSIVRGDNDDDGFNKQNIDIYLSRYLNANNKISLDTGYWKGENKFDFTGDESWLNNYTEYTTKYYSLGLNHQARKLSIDSKLSRTENERFNKPADLSKTIVNTNEWNNSVNYFLSNSTSIHGGIDLRRDYASSTYGSGNYTTKGIYVGSEITAKKVSIEGTVRHEHHNQWGSKNTWSIGGNYTLSRKASIFGSLKTAFSAPTFADLDPTYGNVNLKSEEVRASEFGFRNQLNDTVNTEIVFFKNDFKNLIDYAPDSSLVNIAQASSKGVEISLKQKWSSSDLSSSYSFTQTKDEDGNQLLERPMDNVVITYNQDLSSTVKVYSSLNWINRLKTHGSDGHMPASSTMNLGLMKNYSNSLKVAVKVDNILDEDYQVASDYNGRGRYVEASMSYNF